MNPGKVRDAWNMSRGPGGTLDRFRTRRAKNAGCNACEQLREITSFRLRVKGGRRLRNMSPHNEPALVLLSVRTKLLPPKFRIPTAIIIFPSELVIRALNYGDREMEPFWPTCTIHHRQSCLPTVTNSLRGRKAVRSRECVSTFPLFFLLLILITIVLKFGNTWYD